MHSESSIYIIIYYIGFDILNIYKWHRTVVFKEQRHEVCLLRLNLRYYLTKYKNIMISLLKTKETVVSHIGAQSTTSKT